MTSSGAQQVTETVKDQYEDLPYPLRDPEEEKEKILISTAECLDVVNHICFGGMRDFTKPIRILVAGGGTGDAVVLWSEFLRENKGLEIVYVDLSKASMEVCKERLRVRQLSDDHIKWINDSLLNIPNMDIGEFDFINCCGVLHHLDEPKDGIKALASVLKDEGVVLAMLYAKYGRSAVYPIQDMMRIINEGTGTNEKKEKIANTMEFLRSLPPTNMFIPFFNLLPSSADDNEVYDLLLHSTDRPYTVADVYDFAESADLKMVDFCTGKNWGTRKDYSPENYSRDPEFLAKMAKLPLPEQQAVAEFMNSKMYRHQFFLSKNPTPEIELDLDVIPSFSLGLKRTVNEEVAGLLKQAGGVATLNLQGTKMEFLNGPNLAAIFERLDGETTLKDIFRAVMKNAKGKANFQTLMEEFRPAYEELNKHFIIFLRKAEVPSYPNAIDVQQRVKGLYQ